MNKKYALKAYNEVSNHHFISKEVWDNLAKKELHAEFLTGFFCDTALITPADVEKTLDNTYMVSRGDIREIEFAPCTNPPLNVSPNEKTYTKNDIRVAGALAMADIEDEDEAIVSAIAIAKLINKLN